MCCSSIRRFLYLIPCVSVQIKPFGWPKYHCLRGNYHGWALIFPNISIQLQHSKRVNMRTKLSFFITQAGHLDISGEFFWCGHRRACVASNMPPHRQTWKTPPQQLTHVVFYMSTLDSTQTSPSSNPFLPRKNLREHDLIPPQIHILSGRASDQMVASRFSTLTPTPPCPHSWPSSRSPILANRRSCFRNERLR